MLLYDLNTTDFDDELTVHTIAIRNILYIDKKVERFWQFGGDYVLFSFLLST